MEEESAAVRVEGRAETHDVRVAEPLERLQQTRHTRDRGSPLDDPESSGGSPLQHL